MSTRITQNQRVLFGPVTGRNKVTQAPEPLDGAAVATSGRVNIATIEPGVNPTTGQPDDAYFYAKATGALDPDTPGDPAGLTTVPITVTADADVGAGVKSISVEITLEVVDAGAGLLDVPVGTPEDLP